MKRSLKSGPTNWAYLYRSLCGAWYMRPATATDTTRRFLTTSHLKEGRIGKDWTEKGIGERNVQRHDSTKASFPSPSPTMSTEKGHNLIAPPDEMQQFKGRIICGRCGNSDWTKFTYMMPMDSRVLVQCSHCGLTFFESIEPIQTCSSTDESHRA